ncbi:hypothetical protein CgunFtcFv8_015368 [Champsocephalus gunnari]|uniref:Uncharacterized protein n=1 Tax=Champsocephalus gunnari TaxID=52237 RepID=A0AAN8C6J1_CHAGU|nr:hypothetical protein CgunFtcFv8_015368 [Champsocephalus gunnari]
MPPPSSELLPPPSSELLPALTFLSWPSGPHPWLQLLTTSPTELQIGRHTMPQILIHQHNALTSRTPSLPFSSPPHPLLSIPSFFSPLIHSLCSCHFQKLSPSPSLASLTIWRLGGDWWADDRNHLPPYSGAGRHERDEPELTKPPASETKVVCSIIQTGATPTAASATLTLTNGQRNRWFVHS